MNDKLQQFLDQAFRPYGDFPARKDIEQELLVNLTEKYNDLKAEGKSDDEAYRLTTESFGDVSEIMEQVAPDPTVIAATVPTGTKPSLGKTIIGHLKSAFKEGDSRFRAAPLTQADLSGSQLSGADFSMSALNDATFEKSHMHGAKFKATALNGASFAGADLTKSNFNVSDLQNANLENTNLTRSNVSPLLV